MTAFRSLPTRPALTAAAVLTGFSCFSPLARAADWSGWQSVPDRCQGAIDIHSRPVERKGQSLYEYAFRNRYKQKVTIHYALDGTDAEGNDRRVERTVVLEPGTQKVSGEEQTVPLTRLQGVTLLDITFEGTPPPPTPDGTRVASADTRRLKRELLEARGALEDAKQAERDANKNASLIREAVGTNHNTDYLNPLTGGFSKMSQADVDLADKRAREATKKVDAAQRVVDDLDNRLRAAEKDDEQASRTRTQGSAFLAAAQKAATANDWPGVESAMRSLLSFEGAETLPDEEKALYHANLGRALRQQKKNPEALTAFTEAVKLSPRTAAYRSDLAGVQLSLAHPTDAEASLREAVKISPDEARYHHNLGYALFLQNRFPDAETEFRAAVRLAPQSADYVCALGNTLADQSKSGEAAEAYRTAIRLQPKVALYHTSLAAVLIRDNRLPEAETELRAAAELAPDDPTNQDNLGGVLMAQKKFAEAEAAYNRAARQDTTNATYREHARAAHDAQQAPKP